MACWVLVSIPQPGSEAEEPSPGIVTGMRKLQHAKSPRPSERKEGYHPPLSSTPALPGFTNTPEEVSMADTLPGTSRLALSHGGVGEQHGS